LALVAAAVRMRLMEYCLIESANPKVQAYNGAVMSFVDLTNGLPSDK
jgi:hypothetical protein